MFEEGLWLLHMASYEREFLVSPGYGYHIMGLYKSLAHINLDRRETIVALWHYLDPY